MTKSNDGKRFLVVGATGNTGSLVAASLLSRGESVRCLVRSEEKGKALREAGAEIVVADLESPESLASAFEGIDTVFLLTTVSPMAAEHALNGIDAARSAGVSHVVRYTGALDVGDLKLESNEQHLRVDTALAASGLPFTIVRPQHFTQNLLMHAPTIASDSVIYLPFGAAQVGFVDVRDVADVVVQVMVSGDHLGETLTITGPKSISITEAAEAISNAIGKKVSYVDVPPEAASEGMLSAGMDRWLVDEFVSYFKAFSVGACDFVSDDFERLMGRKPRTVSDFARDHAALFGAETTQSNADAEAAQSSTV